MMDHYDWDSVFEFASDHNSPDYSKQAGDHAPMSQIQVPTPPHSHGGSPISEEPSNDDTVVSVSTTFYPGAQHETQPPDFALLSSDSVFFYVHSHILMAASENRFRSMLPLPKPKDDEGIVLNVQETSTVLNVILHTIYDMSCAHYSPTFETLTTTVKRLPLYGIRPKTRVMPSMPLYSLLLSQAPLYPLELYTLAAQFDLYELAEPTSSHLLAFPLSALTDEMAEKIGAVYLKRLFFLHFGRAEALKRILLPPPHPHAPTPSCDFSDQKKLTRAWALASAYLAWDTRPDLSTSALESALRPLADRMSCELCKEALGDRIKNLIIQWSVVKRTI